jgi:hypothetical protein
MWKRSPYIPYCLGVSSPFLNNNGNRYCQPGLIGFEEEFPPHEIEVVVGVGIKSTRLLTSTHTYPALSDALGFAPLAPFPHGSGGSLQPRSLHVSGPRPSPRHGAHTRVLYTRLLCILTLLSRYLYLSSCRFWHSLGSEPTSIWLSTISRRLCSGVESPKCFSI